MKKDTRTQYTLDQKKSFISQADALVAGGMQLKDAAKKLGINDAYIHTWKRTFKKQGVALAPAPTLHRNGSVIPPMDQKAKWVAQVNELRKTGLPVKEAILKVGIRADDYYRYKQQLAKANGNLPAVVSQKDQKPVEMLNFDLGPAKSPPFVLMIGNAEDMKSTLAQLGNILRGN